VRGLEKYGNSDDIYSGFMPLDLEDNSEGSYFFALVKRRPKDGINFDAKKDKLVVWLNGGPGCSSMVGMMWENGPFTIQEGTDRKYDLKRSEYAWNEVAHMLFVEQPVRTGFSTAAKKRHRIRDENEVASDFYRFLVSFMMVFPELERLPFFISGESYAGTYIPWMAEHILREQARKDRPRDAVVVNLQGVAIGNGQIDFVTHEASYAEYGYFHGLIPLSARQHFEKIYALCIQGVETAPYVTREVFNKCSMMSGVLEAAGRPNEYNTNTFKQYDGVSKPEQVFHRFFNDPEVQEMLHVRGYNLPGVNFSPSLHNNGQFWTNGTTNSTWFEPDTWVVCNNDINDDMVADRPTSAVPALQSIARDNIRVLLYSGEFDMNVNFIGTQHVLEKNLWLGRDWASAERSLYRFKDNVAGEYSNIDGFAFLIVRNAGHLLPMDLPATALDMLNRFLNDRSFKDVSLPTDGMLCDVVLCRK
jgi:carboxypeptidase C (cathepsin A)